MKKRESRTHPPKQQVKTRTEHTCGVCRCKIPKGEQAMLFYRRQPVTELNAGRIPGTDMYDEGPEKQVSVHYSRAYYCIDCEEDGLTPDVTKKRK